MRNQVPPASIFLKNPQEEGFGYGQNGDPTKRNPPKGSDPEHHAAKAGAQPKAYTTQSHPLLVGSRDPGERRARPRGWRLQPEGSEANCGVAETLGGKKLPAQGRTLPLGTVDAR